MGGQARAFFLVNISRQSISDEFAFSSRESTLHFVVSVVYDVTVSDPVRVLEKGIVDVRAHLATELRRRLGRIAAEHSARDLAKVQQCMHAIFERPALAADPIDRAIDVERGHVLVQLDKEAHGWLRETEVSDLRKNAVEATGHIEEAARRGATAASRTLDDLMAQWLATGEERYKLAMEFRIAGMRAGDENRLAWLKVMLENNMIEPHEIRVRFPDMIPALTGSVLGTATEKPAPTIAGPTASEAPVASRRVEIRLPRRPSDSRA